MKHGINLPLKKKAGLKNKPMLTKIPHRQTNKDLYTVILEPGAFSIKGNSSRGEKNVKAIKAKVPAEFIYNQPSKRKQGMWMCWQH